MPMLKIAVCPVTQGITICVCVVLVCLILNNHRVAKRCMQMTDMVFCLPVQTLDLWMVKMITMRYFDIWIQNSQYHLDHVHVVSHCGYTYE